MSNKFQRASLKRKPRAKLSVVTTRRNAPPNLSLVEALPRAAREVFWLDEIECRRFRTRIYQIVKHNVGVRKYSTRYDKERGRLIVVRIE